MLASDIVVVVFGLLGVLAFSVNTIAIIITMFSLRNTTIDRIRKGVATEISSPDNTSRVRGMISTYIRDNEDRILDIVSKNLVIDNCCTQDDIHSNKPRYEELKPKSKYAGRFPYDDSPV